MYNMRYDGASCMQYRCVSIGVIAFSYRRQIVSRVSTCCRFYSTVTPLDFVAKCRSPSEESVFCRSNNKCFTTSSRMNNYQTLSLNSHVVYVKKSITFTYPYSIVYCRKSKINIIRLASYVLYFIG